MRSARFTLKKIAIFAFFFSPFFALAAPLYTPGQTLNPSCGPTDTDCTVSSPALSGSNSDITGLSALTSLTLGSSTITNFLGAGLTITGGALTVNASGSFSTTSSDYWLTQQNSFANLASIGSTTGTTTFLGDSIFNQTVGIGTSSPFTKLGVSGTAFFESAGEGTLSIGKVANRMLEIAGQTINSVINIRNRDNAFDTNGESANIRFSNSDSVFKSLAGQVYRNANGRYTGSPAGEAFELASANDIYLYSGTATSTVYVYASTTAFTGGNVGIGTTSPFATFAINPVADKAANQFVVGSSTRTSFIINNSGNTSIGTTSNTYKFSIDSDTASASALISSKFPSTGGTLLDISSYAGGSNNIRFIKQAFSGVASTAWTIGQDNANDSFTIGRGANYLQSLASTSKYLSIGTTGLVGIGTTSPATKLAVSGDIHVTGALGVGAVALTQGGITLDRASDNPFLLFQSAGTQIAQVRANLANSIVGFTNSAGSTYYLAANTSTGNVGIGTTSPSSLLSLAGSGSTSFNIDSTNTAALQTMGLYENSILKGYVQYRGTTASTIPNSMRIGTQSSSNADTLLETNGSTRIFISGGQNSVTAGYVGIGTTSPDAKLTIASSFNNYLRLGTIGQSGAAGNMSFVRGDGNFASGIIGWNSASDSQVFSIDNGASAGEIRLNPSHSGLTGFVTAYSGGKETLRVTGTNVGIGTTSPWAKLSINNSTTDTGQPLFAVASSTAVATTTVFLIDNKGKVGVGSSTPNNKLSISIANSSDTSDGLVIDRGSGLNSVGLKLISDSNGSFHSAITYRNSVISEVEAISIGSNSSVATNIGIGTSTATGKFAVVGDTSNLANMFMVDFAGGFSNRALVMNRPNQNDINLQSFVTNSLYNASNDPNTGSLSLNALGGNVGVGSSTPGSKLSVHNSPNDTAGQAFFTVASSTSAATTTYFTITNNGNVGIGTTSPVSPLHITIPGATEWVRFERTGTRSWGFSSANGNFTLIDRGANGASVGTLASFTFASTLGGATVGTPNGFGIASSTPWAMLSVNPTSVLVGAPSFAIGSSSGTQFIVTNNGNVGIGTTSPSSLLSIVGGNLDIGTSTGSTAGNLLINGRRLINTYTVNNGASDQSNLFVGEDAGNYTLSSSNGQNASLGYQTLTGLTTGIQNTIAGFRAGNVISSGSLNSGIGGSSCRNITTGSYNTCLGASTGYFGNNNGGQNPAANFSTHIGYGAYSSRSNSMVLGGLAADYADVVIGTSTPFARFGIQGFVGSTTPLFDIASSTDYSFATSSIFRVNPNGNVGIGTSSPASRLAVTQSANTPAGGLWIAETGNTDFRSVYMDTSGILSFYGGDTGGALNTATLNAAGAWTNASDRSYKENIIDLGGKYGLATVLASQPRFYEMKGTHLPQVGFIAQELKLLVPEVVDGQEGKMGISYGNLVAVAFQAIKDLNAKVEGMVKSLFVKELHIEEKLCVDDICINKDELKALLLKSQTATTTYATDFGAPIPQVTLPQAPSASSTMVLDGPLVTATTTAPTTPVVATTTPEIIASSTVPIVIEQPIATTTATTTNEIQP